MRDYIIGIDFDETICDNKINTWGNSTEYGKPKPHAVNVINKLYDEGNYIIIWTARYIEEDLEDVKSFCTKYGIKYHKLNEASDQLQYKSYPKLFFDTVIDDNCLLNIDWRFIPYYINLRKNFVCYPDNFFDNFITDEMIEYFYYRTTDHIKRVIKFTEKFLDALMISDLETAKYIYDRTTANDIMIQVLQHDNTKFDKAIIKEYILLTEKMQCKFGRCEFLPNVKEGLRKFINESLDRASLAHTEISKHHLEYWEDTTEIDAPSIIEMCADLCAMSEENRNDPLQYFNEKIKTKYKINDPEINVINDIINIMWSV